MSRHRPLAVAILLALGLAPGQTSAKDSYFHAGFKQDDFGIAKKHAVTGSEKKPGDQGKVPGAEVKKPGSFGKGPGAEVKKPGGFGQGPGMGVKKPGDFGKDPGAEVKKPGGFDKGSGGSMVYESDQGGARQPAGRANQPTYDKEAGAYVWGDGTRVRATAPDGSVGKVNEKGDIVYSDGTTVVHGDDGSVTVHRPDGSSSSYEVDRSGAWQPAGRDNQPTYDKEAGAYVWGDGTRVRAAAPDGSLGKVNEKGDIVYSDGTTVVHGDDGSVTVHRPDGSSQTYTTNEDGSWSSSSDSGDDSSHTSDDSGSSSGSDSDSGSGSSDDKKGSDDSGGGDSNDSDSGSESDTESGSDDSADEKPEEGGSDKQDYGNGSHHDGPSATVEAILDRASGRRRDPESGQPEECEERGFGGGVVQPGAGGQGNCLPAGTPGIEPEERSTPDAGEAATDVDRRNRSRGDVRGRITQPGFGDFDRPGNDLPALSPFDRAPVTNPGEPR